MMLLGTEKVNAHTPQPELYAEFHYEAKILVAQHLHNSEVRSHVRLASVFLWISHGTKSLLSQHTGKVECLFSFLCEAIGILEIEFFVGKNSLDLFVDCLVFSIQNFCHLHGVKRLLRCLLGSDGLAALRIECIDGFLAYDSQSIIYGGESRLC